MLKTIGRDHDDNIETQSRLLTCFCSNDDTDYDLKGALVTALKTLWREDAADALDDD